MRRTILELAWPAILVKSLLTHVLLTEKDVVICDMEAGVEHLGRGKLLQLKRSWSNLSSSFER